MDVFVMPSKKEGMPMALLEAMAMELPVVATDVGGISFVVGKNEGLLVDAGNSEALSSAIFSLINDPSLRGDLGKNARAKVVREFSIDACYRKYREVYKNVLGELSKGNEIASLTPAAYARNDEKKTVIANPKGEAISE